DPVHFPPDFPRVTGHLTFARGLAYLHLNASASLSSTLAAMNKSRRITIKHIAHESGVSIATVSNVLNGNIKEMGKDTLLRVQAVIRRLNYSPNPIARGLVTRRTATVGLILAEIETPLFLQALTSIERGARDGGYGLLLLHARSGAEEREAVDLLLEK